MSDSRKRIEDLTSEDLADFSKGDGVFPVVGKGGFVDLQFGLGNTAMFVVGRDEYRDLGGEEDCSTEGCLVKLGNIFDLRSEAVRVLSLWRFLCTDGVEMLSEKFFEFAIGNIYSSGNWHVDFVPSEKAVAILSYMDDVGSRYCAGLPARHVTIGFVAGGDGKLNLGASMRKKQVTGEVSTEDLSSDSDVSGPVDLKEEVSVLKDRVAAVLKQFTPAGEGESEDDVLVRLRNAFPEVPERCFADVQQFFAWLAKYTLTNQNE